MATRRRRLRGFTPVAWTISRRWGCTPDRASLALVSWCGNRVASGESRPRVGKAMASRTPYEFRDLLLSIARAVDSTAVPVAFGAPLEQRPLPVR